MNHHFEEIGAKFDDAIDAYESDLVIESKTEATFLDILIRKSYESEDYRKSMLMVVKERLEQWIQDNRSKKVWHALYLILFSLKRNGISSNEFDDVKFKLESLIDTKQFSSPDSRRFFIWSYLTVNEKIDAINVVKLERTFNEDNCGPLWLELYLQFVGNNEDAIKVISQYFQKGFIDPRFFLRNMRLLTDRF